MKYGIIGAMDIEIEMLLAELTETRTVTRAGMTFHEGKVGDTEAVIVRCGIGKVNAGICVQILADLFNVDCVINTGIAGSLSNRLDIGDIVISTDAIQHDMDVTKLGYVPGEIPQIGVVSFTADPKLRTRAVKACRKAAPDINVMEGRITTGDQFIASMDRKREIIEVFGGLCTEMEGAAIAQAAYLNDLPYVIVRAISDKADDSGAMSYAQFEKMAAMHCSGLVLQMLKS